ncbi:hypothetical protein SD80_004650 [Scytonema tolypothrichoides VB-61278]|nr:hypothetical protein SD80_004650 [Scytonema tolypothrichoides VB-61278]
MSYPENEKSQEQSTDASGGYQTTIDEETRKTGAATEVGAKESAKPESGGSDQFVEGAPNQGTEKR